MKRIIMLSALTGVLAFSGCTTMKDMMGMNGSSMNTPSATNMNAKAVPVTSQNGMLVGSNGMTLYTFDKDTMNKSNCMGDCLKAWPALMANSGDKAVGQYSTFQREDGSYQWAVNGKPLYYFIKDQKVGDMMGDNVKGVWHIVRTQ